MGNVLKYRKIIPILLASFVMCGSCTDHDKVEGQKQLDAEIAAIKVRGEPFSLADFADTPIDPSQNAVELCRQVWQKMNLSDDEKKVAWTTDELPLTPDKYKPLDEFLDRYGHYLPDIRSAAKTSDVRWNIKQLSKPEDLYSIRDAAPIRFLSTMCLNDALRAMRQGDQLRALDDIEAMFGLARIYRKMPAIIAAMIAASIDNQTVELLQYVVPTLNFTDGKIAGKAHALFNHLLEESEYTSDYRRQVWAERLICYLGDDTVLFHHPDEMASQTSRARLLIYFGQIALASDFHEAHSALPAEVATAPPLPSGTLYDKKGNQYIASHTAGTIDLAIKLHFLSLANRRLAATALALNLYRIEKGNGRLPADLAELVSQKYLTAIPLDSLAESGRHLGYLPNAPEPIVYSVGNNLRDDGGNMEMEEKSQPYGRVRAMDIIFRLNKPIH